MSHLQLPPYERVGGAAHGRGRGELPPAQPRPHQPGRHQGRCPAHQVHAAAAWTVESRYRAMLKHSSPVTRDVHAAELVEEASLCPEPARGHGVHDGVDQGEDAVRVEVEPEDVKDVCDKMNDDMMTHLSAMAPDTMVAAVAANTNWNISSLLNIIFVLLFTLKIVMFTQIVI